VATIVVGIEDSPRGQDAVALASDLARASGAEVLAVCAYPHDPRPGAAYNPVMQGPMLESAEATLARLIDPLRSATTVHTLATPDPAPARALLRAATDADLIVIGSSHAGFSGHVLPGGTGERLLHGAPCPVALAPQGYRLQPHLNHGRISVGFEDTPNGHAAVSAAAVLARATGLPLRVVTVHDPDCADPAGTHMPPAYLRLGAEAERAARTALEHMVADLPHAEPAFLIGDPALELARESQVSECLVIGSRGYGPAPAVLLGDIGRQLARTAECPLLVVPNGVARPLSKLYGQLRTKVAA
jgi:nucleotide-binding universal stress UspA family protein